MDQNPMAQTKSNGTYNVNSVQIARDWLELGIRTVPIQPGKKKPVGSSWQKLRLTNKTIPNHFQSGYNVGGLWGAPSGWVVDIDLDDEDAADVAEFLLPRTVKYGRESRPATHFLYICKGAKTHKWMDARKKMIVEIRSTGSQSVLPPSIHPDKERYIVDDWNDDEFTIIPRIKLMRHLDEIAACTLFVRAFPKIGSRHDFIHAMTGALLWSKLKPEDARRLARAVIYATQDEDDDPKQRLRTVENTLEHFKKGNRIAGWPVLKDWMDNRDIQIARKWISHKDFEEPLPEPEQVTRSQHGAKFDMSLLEVPGIVGDLIKWSAKQTYLEQPAFDLATALMCTALASCNHYEVDNWNTPLQPYFMLLARTAGGKGASLDRVYDFAKQLKLDQSVFQHFQSYYAMMDQLAEVPNMVCWLWDEAGRHLMSARNTSSQDYQVLSHIISLYGRANTGVPGVPGRKNPIPPLENPFLLLFATTQPAVLIEAISQSDLATGFVNRLMLFDSGDEVPERNQQRENIFPAKIKQKALKILKHEPKQRYTKIVFKDTETYALFDDFGEQNRSKITQTNSGEIWGRALQNALVVAGIVAVGVDPTRPVINAEIASWAIRLVTWSVMSWSTRVEDLSSTTFRERFSKRVEQYIRSPSTLDYSRCRASHRAMLNKNLVPRTLLIRKCRALSSRDLDDIIEQLAAAGLIGVGEKDDITVYWPKGR